MSETIEKIKSKQGIIAKIQDIFGLGYATKEDLRELDKKLRDFYYADLKSLRHRWEEIYLEALNGGQRATGEDFKKVMQVLDRVAEKINRADYGYAGLMDRKGHIRESELAKVFDYDKALGGDIDAITNAVDALYSDSEAHRWTDVPTKVRNIKSQLLNFETKWTDREREFRPLEV
jgi:5-methylthioribose kinase